MGGFICEAMGTAEGTVRRGPGVDPRGCSSRRRDVKAVHRDVTALLNAGLIERAEGGGIVFPFEAVKVEFMLQAA